MTRADAYANSVEVSSAAARHARFVAPDAFAGPYEETDARALVAYDWTKL